MNIKTSSAYAEEMESLFRLSGCFSVFDIQTSSIVVWAGQSMAGQGWAGLGEDIERVLLQCNRHCHEATRRLTGRLRTSEALLQRDTVSHVAVALASYDFQDLEALV